jgi:hypothetical protein
MDDAEAYEYYADPAHRAITGPGRKRIAPRLTTMTSVRFAPEVVEAVKGIASEEGITVGSWVRRLVQREIEPACMMEVACEGLDEPLLVPQSALSAITAAAMPALIKHGAVSLQIGTPRPMAGAERPTGLIEHSGRRGEPKVLSSSLSLRSRSFACPHLSVGGVVSVTCETCGPLQAAA